MIIIGHRGSMADRPENTMVSFERAVAAGAGGIECDVHLSSDNVPVVIHDPDTIRTTGISSTVEKTPARDLSSMDAGSYFSSIYEGEPVPLLEETAAWAAERNVTLHVELKEQLYHKDEETVAQILETLSPLNEKNIVISTFCHRYIPLIKKKNPAIEAALLTKSPFRRGPAYANLIQADSIHIRHTPQAAWYYSRWAGTGMSIRVYNVRNLVQLKRLSSAGVSGVIVDNPALMMRL
ncbi:glycerophosphodiester phosphodiesterase [Alkalicoccus urumqiensis]|uniref:glycerophosphodiester phosphodiesterase n=1 Tax=Alkalicoccus urumqiensis TaxID=1548213 RepID=UPI0015E5E080|nr:glycerophosphodiester phosphodiesterase family protein [Alkalicoccus urumqiensis]